MSEQPNMIPYDPLDIKKENDSFESSSSFDQPTPQPSFGQTGSQQTSGWQTSNQQVNGWQGNGQQFHQGWHGQGFQNTPNQSTPRKKENRPYKFEIFPVKNRILGLLIAYPLYFYLISAFILPPISSYIYEQNTLSDYGITVFANLIYQLITLIPLLIIMHGMILQALRDIRKRPFINLVGSVFLSYCGFFFLNVIASMIESILIGEEVTSQNQEAVNSFALEFPFAMFIVSVLFAPVVEELLFRGLLFRTLRPLGRIPAILVSAFLFGFIHVMDYVLAGDFHEMLYIITYLSMGIGLGIIYETRRNIVICILVHMMQNTIAFAFMMLAS